MMNKEEKTSNVKVERGQIWLIKFKKVEDNKSIRSCLVISNNTQNEFDERIVVVGTTTKGLEKIQPFEVFIENTPETGLDKPSKILLKELGENVDYASTELISQDDQISKLKGERIDFKFKIQQLEKDLSLAQRLAEMRKNPLPNYEKDLAPDFWPYLIWPLTLILIYWMLKSKHG